jgi:hypothetical protein
MDFNFLRVKLELLEIHPEHRNIYSSLSADDLIPSILESGFVERLKIVKRDTPYREGSKYKDWKCEYYIISGARRFKALKALKYAEADCELYTFHSLSEEIEQILLNNQHRKKSRYEILRETLRWRKLEKKKIKENIRKEKLNCKSKSDLSALRSRQKELIRENDKRYNHLARSFSVIRRIDALRSMRKLKLSNILIRILNEKSDVAAYHLSKCPDEMIEELGTHILSLTRKLDIGLYIQEYRKLYFERKSQALLRKEHPELMQPLLLQDGVALNKNVGLFSGRVPEHLNVNYKGNVSRVTLSNIFNDSYASSLPSCSCIFMDTYYYEFTLELYNLFKLIPGNPFIVLALGRSCGKVLGLLDEIKAIYQLISIRYRPNIYTLSKRWFIDSRIDLVFLNPYNSILCKEDGLDSIYLDMATDNREVLLSEGMGVLSSYLMFGGIFFDYYPKSNRMFKILYGRLNYDYYCLTNKERVYFHIDSFYKIKEGESRIAKHRITTLELEGGSLVLEEDSLALEEEDL